MILIDLDLDSVLSWRLPVGNYFLDLSPSAHWTLKAASGMKNHMD